MSSMKLLTQNGFFSPLKRIASFEKFASSNAETGRLVEGCRGEDVKLPRQDDVWRSIQSMEEEKKSAAKLNIWSSILAEKSNSESDDVSPPYVHPLVKRTTSALSEKSLEICTENLGSETGSDDFSSYALSETMEGEKGNQNSARKKQVQGDKFQFYAEESIKIPGKRSPPRSFPPPLPSLAGRDGSTSVHMHSHRTNGRLVLEAVSVPKKNFFHAKRGEGRLVLSFVHTPADLQDKCFGEITEENKVGEFENVHHATDVDEVEKSEFAVVDAFDDFEEAEDDDEDGDEKEEKQMKFVMQQSSSSMPNGVINIQNSTLMMKSLMRMENKAVRLTEIKDPTPLLQSLPPQPPPPPRVARLIPTPSPVSLATASTTSFNSYEHFWKKKPTITSIITQIKQQCDDDHDHDHHHRHHHMQQQQDQWVVMRGKKADYLVPLLMRSCKESKRSLLIWQPHCVATS